MKKHFYFIHRCVSIVYIFFLSVIILVAQPQDTLYIKVPGVVIGQKVPSKLTALGKSVSVLNNDRLVHAGATDMSQLLNEVGITVNGAYSNPSTVKGLFMRGASSPYTLLMMDGIPLYNPIQSGADMRLYSPLDYASLEVLWGGASTLYGSHAVAGAVNMLTPRMERHGTSLQGTFGGGHFASYQYGGRVESVHRIARGGGLEWGSSVGVSVNQSAGINEARVREEEEKMILLWKKMDMREELCRHLCF